MTGIVFIVVSLLILVCTELLKNPEIQLWYFKYQKSLSLLENRIASMDNKWVIVICIYFLFSLKAILPVPLFPISCICVISGIVYNTLSSVIINSVGMVVIFSIRYAIGKKHSSFTNRLLKSYDSIWKILERDGKGNPILLFSCRLIPMFPINSVSSIYGNIGYDFNKYLLFSLLGFLPKILSYSYIGRNVYDPLSDKFLIPIIILLLLSGIGLIITRQIINYAKNKGDENDK